MKQTPKLIYALLPLAAVLTGGAHAAISIPNTTGVTVNFATAPAAADFASVSVGGAVGDLAILGTAATGIDNTTTGVSATLAWSASTNWTTNTVATMPTAQSLNAAMRYVTGSGNILTGPTGNRYSALIGRFQNNTTGAISSFNLGYNLAVPFAPGGTGAVGTDPLVGLHTYYSKTGATGSWTLISAANSTAGAVGPTPVTIPGNIPEGGDIYIAWVDDNGPGGGTAPNLEGNFTVDDIAITGVTLAAANITASVVANSVVRNDAGTPTIPTDDTVSFSLNVAGTGAVSGQHRITTPAAIADVSPVNNGTRIVTGVPIAQFSGAGHTLTGNLEDSVTSSVTASFTVTAPWGGITPAASGFFYNDNATPGDAADDTAGYSLSATSLFAGADYTLDTVPTGTPATFAYGNGPNVALPATATGPSEIRFYSFTDLSDTTLTATRIISPPAIIGTNTTSGSPVNVMSLGNANGSTWTFDGAARTLQMADGDRNGAGTTAKEVQSATVDLSAVSGFVKFTLDMTATDGSSGFEAGDTFVATLYLNDGVNPETAVNLISQWDTNANGFLQGTEIVAANATKTFNMSYFIQDNIQSARVVISGVCESAATSEKMDVSNLTFSVAPPSLSATAGAVTFNNNGTVTAADDSISAPVTITPVNLGASPGWTSNSTPATGLYSDPQPVTFTAAAAPSPAVVTVTDTNNIGVTTQFSLTRPAITFAASLAAGSIVRNDNGPGDADDTLTFTLNVASTNASPQFAIDSVNPVTISGTGAYPAGGSTTITLGNLPVLAGNVVLVVHDAGYPLSSANVTIAVPAAAAAGPSVMGQKDFGSGLQDVLVGAPNARWVNYPGQRQVVMTAGTATDSVVETEGIDLTTVGGVNFSAQLRARDVSAGSNLDIGDRFKAELHLDGGSTIIPLITAAMDPGDGSPSTTGTGANGAPNGYINGYTGAAGTDVLTSVVYAAAIDDYNANRSRDEFNTAGQAGAERMTGTITLSSFIPSTANNVKLVIYGAGVAGSESLIVENVLFTLGGPADTDGDGMDDTYEDTNGLDKNSAADKLTDLDGDGANNYAEFLAGNRANDASSVFTITAQTLDSTTGAFSLTWSSVAGKRYRIFSSPNMQAGTWTDVSLADIPSAGASTTATGTLPAPIADRAFFYVQVMP